MSILVVVPSRRGSCLSISILVVQLQRRTTFRNGSPITTPVSITLVNDRVAGYVQPKVTNNWCIGHKVCLVFYGSLTSYDILDALGFRVLEVGLCKVMLVCSSLSPSCFCSRVLTKVWLNLDSSSCLDMTSCHLPSSFFTSPCSKGHTPAEQTEKKERSITQTLASTITTELKRSITHLDSCQHDHDWTQARDGHIVKQHIIYNQRLRFVSCKLACRQ